MKALKMDQRQPAATAVAASSAPLTPSSKSWDHMPRKRRRFMGQMNLMLLIFVGCGVSSILWPQFSVAAASDSSLQDFGSVTAKGENIFMLASSSNNNNAAGDDLGNAFPGSIQGKDDEYDDDDNDGNGDDNNQGDATNGAKMPLMSNARKEQASNEDIEMMQRSPQTSNMPVPSDHKPQSENNRHLRYQQIQQALREPITPLPPKHYHQRHHHQHHNNHHHQQQQQQQQQHYRHHGRQHTAGEKEEQEDEFKWPLPPPRSRQHYEHHQRQQHLRHHQRQHLHHHRRHNFTGTATTTSSTTTTTTMRPRYFDRDGLYSNPMAWLPPATQGPLHEEAGEAAVEEDKPNKHLYNPHNRLFSDGGDDQQKQEDKEQEFKRISLSLDAQKDNSGGDNGENILKFDDDLNADDDDDDYSYEDDLEELSSQKNKSPPVSGPNAAKINVKRYTAPIRNPYKPSSSASSYSSRKRPQPSSVHNSFDEDYDSQVSNDNLNNNNSDDDDDFSDEKWNKIEHEHYRKQQQHQRAMQALRSRRPFTGSPTMDNSPNNSNKNNKYSSSSASSSVLSKSTASAKRPVLNEDDSDNIYSRYYVPGTVTRKKEEELGSPTSVLESRRQYALQQRQNKAFASAHHRRIVKEGSCRIPQPRVERIRRDSWKIYTPHCTILHRCADDTGCCPTERQTCAPKRTKNVDLYFFVISLNETQGSIEKLTFVNHTECHCVDKSKQRSALYEADEPSSEIASNHIPYLRRATILNCNCPNLFEKILQEDGFCRCDCSSGNMGCDWLKRGMEHFSMNDRKCILEGRCKLPTCEYGTYMKKVGRCPRREERQVSMDTVDW